MKLTATILQNDRLRLEPLNAGHIEALRPGVVDREVWQYNPFAHLNDETNVRRWLELQAVELQRGDGLAFAVIDRVSGCVAGSTSVYDFSSAHRRIEVGRTFLIPRYWRSFVNTQAKLLLLRYCFEVIGVNRVQLKTDARNLRSQRAIERLGAVREGVLRAHMLMPDGFVRDSVVFSVIREDWPAVEARLRTLLDRAWETTN